jgi:predicted kinase
MALGDELDWPVLRSDELRKQRAGLAPRTRGAAGYKEGLYSPSVTDATYVALLEDAQRLLEEGQSVIVDASFSRSEWRAAAAAVATQASAVLVEVRCTLPSDIAAERLRDRGVRGTDASDADASIATAMQSEFDEWPTATAVDTRSLPPLVAARVRQLVDPGRD